MASKKALDEAAVLCRVRTKFGDEAKGWVVFEQVASGTGAMRRRYADAVAMNMWPSKGLEIVGFEVKVSRGDWLRELRSRSKVEDGVFQYCDRWYVVAGGPGIVQLEELPKPWGLLEPHGAGLKATKVAPELKPEEVDRFFLAAVLRRAKLANSFTSEDKLRAERNRGYQQGEKRAEERVKYELERLRLVVEKTKAFEKASGISVEWERDSEQLGRLVKAVRGGELEGALNRVRSAENIVTELAESLKSNREALEEALEPADAEG